MRTPTPEQQAIITSNLAPGTCLKIIAYAGTGKTTTFVDYANARPSDDMLYLAFNKSVETEAKRKFDINVVAKTVHALAYGEIGKKYQANLVNNIKSWEIAKLLHVPLYDASIVRNSLDNYLNSADTEPLEAHVVPDELGLLAVDYKERVVDAITNLWEAMKSERIGMTHNGYLKLYQLAKPRLKWPTILLDEAQDTNPVTQALVLDQLQYGTKVILCGDPYQQIYSWRGAVDAMANIECETLRLTKSFRFGDNIASTANHFLRRLLNEPIPVVGHEQQPPDRPDKATICRTNAGLFDEAIGLASCGARFSIVGEQRFDWLLTDVLDIYAIFKGRRPVGKAFYTYASFEDLKDKAEKTLDYELQVKARIVEKHQNSIPDHVASVRKGIVSAANADVCLVTGHQAKGLEWSHVTLSSDFPSLQNLEGRTKTVVPVADKNDENLIAREEINLLYVACTRAKRVLEPGVSVRRFVDDGR